MSSVLFHERTPAVEAIIDERRRWGNDRFDEVWEGVYVVNPPPSFDQAVIARRIGTLLDQAAEPLGLVTEREVGIGGPESHRIPDVVVADPADLDDARHYLRTAAIVVEVRSPHERIDKRPFYLAHGVTEVVHVDPATGTVEWLARTADGAAYEPVDASTVLPLGPADIAALLDR